MSLLTGIAHVDASFFSYSIVRDAKYTQSLQPLAASVSGRPVGCSHRTNGRNQRSLVIGGRLGRRSEFHPTSPFVTVITEVGFGARAATIHLVQQLAA